MTKRLTVKVDEYQKDGQTKGKYLEVGVLMENGNGEYILLDPCIDLSGVLVKQNALAAKQGKEPKTSVMVSVFDGQQQNQQPGGFQQQPQQQYQQHPNQTGGFAPQNNNQPPL